MPNPRHVAATWQGLRAMTAVARDQRGFVPASRVGQDARSTTADELFDDLRRRPAWHADAACREHPEIDWFPTRGAEAFRMLRAARQVCAGCLVRDECLDFALADPTIVGVWAGTTALERKKMRREPQAGAAD